MDIEVYQPPSCPGGGTVLSLMLEHSKIKRTKSLLCEIFEHRGNKENSKWSERAA